MQGMGLCVIVKRILIIDSYENENEWNKWSGRRRRLFCVKFYAGYNIGLLLTASESYVFQVTWRWWWW